MASGGMGDVLGGIIAALLARGIDPFDAACAAVYLHGFAGDLLRDEMGDTGLAAMDLAERIPMAIQLKRLTQASSAMTLIPATTALQQRRRDDERAGREIARTLAPDAVVHLVGDLGAGKTFLARAIAAELGADPHEVASPSFAIVHEYPRRGGAPIIHIDGYRLSENRREWLEIGIPELLPAPA